MDHRASTREVVKRNVQRSKQATIYEFVVCVVSGQIPVMEQEPEFLQPLENHTVTQGRDIFFTCVVNHLGSYKVCDVE
jgi:hypothetical protein